MNPPMPTRLTVVRVLLFVYVGLAAVGLLSFFWLTLAGGMAFEEVLAATGTPTGLFLAGVLLAVAILTLALMAALRMGDGGRRSQTLLRSALILLLLGVLINVVQGTGYLAFACVLVTLVLAETRAAKHWFAATEADNDHGGARPLP